MTTVDQAGQIEAEDLAQARDMVQMILRDWDWMTWNELLAPDVVLKLRFGAVDCDRFGGLIDADSTLQVTGRESARAVLSRVDRNLKAGLSLTTEVVSGYDAVLLGTLRLPSATANAPPVSMPVALYIGFDASGQIHTMTLAAVDLQPLTDAFRSAARNAAP